MEKKAVTQKEATKKAMPQNVIVPKLCSENKHRMCIHRELDASDDTDRGIM